MRCHLLACSPLTHTHTCVPGYRFNTLRAQKEFLIIASLALFLLDLFDIYGNIIRVTGTTMLPFWGNHTELYMSSIPELSWFDMGVTIWDLGSVTLLCLSVCADSVDGLVCSLCGLATAMLGEAVYVIWLAVAVAIDAVAEVNNSIARALRVATTSICAARAARPLLFARRALLASDCVRVCGLRAFDSDCLPRPSRSCWCTRSCPTWASCCSAATSSSRHRRSGATPT